MLSYHTIAFHLERRACIKPSVTISTVIALRPHTVIPHTSVNRVHIIFADEDVENALTLIRQTALSDDSVRCIRKVFRQRPCENRRTVLVTEI